MKSSGDQSKGNQDGRSRRKKRIMEVKKVAEEWEIMRIETLKEEREKKKKPKKKRIIKVKKVASEVGGRGQEIGSFKIS